MDATRKRELHATLTLLALAAFCLLGLRWAMEPSSERVAPRLGPVASAQESATAKPSIQH
jgi:hypothetical protein